jgi:diguanylate cyclase (GGDEF)-like protein/PAS domain S-box-containing protein
MAEVALRGSVDETLQLALDVCLGIGAFWVTPAGTVDATVSDAMPPEDGLRRIEHLARDCLSHPAAAGRDLFWNAEVSTEADTADRCLACVVVPARVGEAPAGLLGVVDTWLPEPDEAQRAALAALAAELAESQPVDGGGPAGTTHGSGADLFAPEPANGPGAPSVHPGTGAMATPTVAAVGPCANGGAPTPGPVDGLALDVLRHLPDAVVVTRGDGTIVFVNDRFAHMVGRTVEDLAGSDVRSVVSASPGGAPGAGGIDPGSGHRPVRRLVVTGRSGEELPVTAVDVRVGGVGGVGAGGGCFVTVLRPAPSAEGCSAATRIDCVDLVGNLDDGVLCLDGTGTVVLSNRVADRFHGLAAGRTLVGSPLPDMTGLCTEDGQPLTAESHPGLLALREGAACAVQLVLGGDGDRQQHVTVTARPFPVDGHRGALVVLRDSTNEWLEQRRLTQYALYDPLTGLANRYLLLEELRRMLLLLGRQGGAVALVYLDLDGFKQINDEYGHDMGDEVLAAVARRLRGAVRSDDVVARLGGDEFVIAHASTGDRLPDGDLVVSRLRKVLSAPFRVRSQAFDVGASIGWVSTVRGEEGPDALLAKADRAMYLQKRNRAAARRGPA